MASSTTVATACWYDGRTATGAYSSNRWFLVRSSDRYEAFVHSSWVRGQTRVRWCGNSVRVRAGLQAMARLGKTNPTQTNDAGYFSSSDWAPGPYGEWSGDCAKFA